MLKNTLKIIVSMIMCVLSFTFIHICMRDDATQRGCWGRGCSLFTFNVDYEWPVEGRNEGHDEQT